MQSYQEIHALSATMYAVVSMVKKGVYEFLASMIVYVHLLAWLHVWVENPNILSLMR